MEEPFIPVHTRRNRSSGKNKRETKLQKLIIKKQKKKVEDPPFSYNALHFAKEERKDKIKEINKNKRKRRRPSLFLHHITTPRERRKERQNNKQTIKKKENVADPPSPYKVPQQLAKEERQNKIKK